MQDHIHTSPSVPSIKQLRKRISECFGADRGRLHRKLTRLSHSKVPTDADDVAQIVSHIETSCARVAQRKAGLPTPTYPVDLPVADARTEIIQAIKNNQVTIICGETGSGKTTQLPKMCLELGRGTRGFIGHTQPRRIAARSVAARIASELNSQVGDTVGFKVRFSDHVDADSYVKLMTDGILLAELQSDRWLNQYDTLIIDEAHERSLNIDFLLGVLKQLLPKRPDLKIIITSATIDPQRFSKHFDEAPIILVEGRTYPVEVRYQPLLTTDDASEKDLTDTVAECCSDLIADSKGATGGILVFLPGERHIRECAEWIKKQQPHDRHLNAAEVLPLYARLTPAEQSRIFSSRAGPRIILSTNVAETSLTVPGIRFVVDSGLARISRYSVRSKVQRLPIEKISRASADQRKGRCGRVGPGVCIRLYAEDDFEARPEFTEPEILRTNLAAVVLQMESMRLGEIDRFPFVEKPDDRLVRDGYKLLYELGAVSEKNVLTSLGKKLARLPVEPRFARMLIAASEEMCVTEILTITSAMSVLDPRERPQDKQQAADEMHAEFADGESDFNSWLNLWTFIDVQWQRLSRNKFRKMCQSRFLSYLRIREWQDVRRQLHQQAREVGLKGNTEPASYPAIHRALLSGLLGNVCVKDEKYSYLGTRNRKLRIFPGSGVRKKQPKWIVAAEISETSQLYARSVAKIEFDWIERMSVHLLKYSYSQARWEKKRGQVGAKEKSTLYGLIINPGKWVNFGPINSVESREIFIRDGLVAGQLSTDAGFYHHNLQLIDEVLDLEHKSRRRDILVSPEELVQFYDRLIPDQVYSLPTFERWRKEFEAASPKGLYFAREQLIDADDADVDDREFPDHLEIGSATFPLSYSFSPGSENDGVTITIPVNVLNRVDEQVCEWLVPGLLLEKVTALIKSLPKSLRRNFVPAPDVAQQCVASFELSAPPAGGLLRATAAYLSSRGSVAVNHREFELSLLAPHLLMRFEVIDGKGKSLVSGRNLSDIAGKFSRQTESHLAKIVAPTLERESINDWNFGDLPDSVEVEEPAGNSAVKLLAYPALCSEESSISLRVFPSRAEADQSMRTGVRALYQKVLKNEYRYVLNRMPGIDALCLIYAPFGSSDVLRHDLADAVFDAALLAKSESPRTRDEFYQRISTRQKQLIPTATTLLEYLDSALREYQALSRRIAAADQLSWVEPLQDIKAQLTMLYTPGFITRAGTDWLRRYSVYMKAIDRRLDAIDKSPEQDRRKRAEFLPLWERFQQLPESCDVDTVDDDPIYRLRWQLEELRVSLFAQSLGTVEKVSVQRLENALEKFIAER